MWLLNRLVAGTLALTGAAVLDAFEYITFTPPPAWSVLHADGGRQHVRHEPSGSGLIILLASQPATGAPSQVFSPPDRLRPDLP